MKIKNKPAETFAGFYRYKQNMNKYSEYFSTCHTPEEMALMGVFGGGYFYEQAIPNTEFDRQADKTPEILSWPNLRNCPDFKKVNHFHIRAGLDFFWWRDKGLLDPMDPYGWYQWYINYHSGRRTYDDARQIDRFRSFVSRQWKGLANKMERRGEPMGNARELYPRACQSMLQWGWDFRVDPSKHLLK
jgi:hypothetical protein